MKEMHTIRCAKNEDIGSIMGFIKSYWSARHILANDLNFFHYQHVHNEEVCFVIAINNETGVIEGLEGYIPYTKEKRCFASLALWKVIKNSDPLLGVKLLKYIEKEIGLKITFAPGINKKTSGIYEYLGYTVDKLKHYYRITDKENYQVAVIKEKVILPVAFSEIKLNLVSDFCELENSFNFEIHGSRKPYKDMWYIQHRYFEHPIYTYKVYSVCKQGNKFNSILVTREIVQDGVKVLRIIDYIGIDDELAQISYEIQNLLKENDYEYIDFYCYGISDEIMRSAGFKLKDERDSNIIPNYFEPFVRENVDINFFTSNIDDFYLFKGDGDQDRPSFW